MSKKAPTDFYFQKKARVVKRNLANNIGIYARLKDGLVMASKCMEPFYASLECGINDTAVVVGVSNSRNSNKYIDSAARGLRTEISREVSPRDFSADVLTQHLSSDIEKDYYDSEVEKIFSSELLVMNWMTNCYGIHVIKYTGEVVVFNLREQKLVTFGCGDPKKEAALIEKMTAMDIGNLTIVEFKEILDKELETFEGDLMIHDLAMTVAEPDPETEK